MGCLFSESRFLKVKVILKAAKRIRVHSVREVGDLINSRFGVLSYSNFSFLTPTFWKVSIDKYGKTPTFSGGQHFTPIFKILVRTLEVSSDCVDKSEDLEL